MKANQVLRYQYKITSMINIPEISWKEIHGNQFTRRIHPAMLTSSGYTTTMNTLVHGSSAQLCKVKYDREYVVELIARRICHPLRLMDSNDFAILLSDAWRTANNETVQFIDLAKDKELEVNG